MTFSSRLSNDVETRQPFLYEDETDYFVDNIILKQKNFYESLTRKTKIKYAIFIVLIIVFGIFYFKFINKKHNKVPIWPKPSNSFYGEFSTAAVAADNELCSTIARDILLKGGNAVDAAIAAAFCIGVTDTQSAGLGGGHFMTIYNATTKKCHVVDAREVAPLNASKDMYKNEWEKAVYGWKAVAVPGELHGLWTEFINFSSKKISWKSLIQPTIDLMEEGYPTSHALARSLKNYKKFILLDNTMRSHFVNPLTEEVYDVGEQITTRKNLIDTLKIIANSTNPIKEFYNGTLTNKMVEEFKKNSGIITFEDFSHYKSIIRSDADVIYTTLEKKNLTICGPPPPSSSAVSQAIINIMNGFDFDLTKFDEIVNFFHKYIESSKFSYAIRSELGDMDFVPNATKIAKKITTSDWANLIRLKIKSKPQSDDYYTKHNVIAPEDHGTAHISVVDKEGNAVSITSTINIFLGALVMSESTGILWNNEMDDFSLPDHPNYFNYSPSPANFIQPGKRPLSSMCPLVLFNSNTKEVLAVGGSGGSTIISGVASVVLHHIWFKNTIKEAVDFPRLHNQLRPNVTHYEQTWPVQYIDELKKIGHQFVQDDYFTVITAVHKTCNKTVFANSDYRKGVESEPSGF